jgi:hypothetical protein
MLIETPKSYTPRGIKVAKVDVMSPEEFTQAKWKFSKMGHFSASMTPSLLGLYKGPQSVFKQMRGEEVVDFSNPKIRFGQLAEDWVADMASKMLDIDVFKEPWMLGSTKHSWITATKDFHISDNPYYEGRWGMEVKTTSSWGIRKKLGRHLSEDTAPSYYIQSQHQMYVDELDGVINPVMIIQDASALSWAINEIEEGLEDFSTVVEEVPHEIRCYVIHRDAKFIEDMEKTLIQMREIYLRGDMPSSDIATPTIDTDSKSVSADADLYGRIQSAVEKRERGRALIEEAKTIELDVLKGLDGNGVVTWRGAEIFSVKTFNSQRLNVKLLREELPSVAEEYTITTSSQRVNY